MMSGIVEKTNPTPEELETRTTKASFGANSRTTLNGEPRAKQPERQARTGEGGSFVGIWPLLRGRRRKVCAAVDAQKKHMP